MFPVFFYLSFKSLDVRGLYLFIFYYNSFHSQKNVIKYIIRDEWSNLIKKINDDNNLKIRE
jgi:hypothetical protein